MPSADVGLINEPAHREFALLEWIDRITAAADLSAYSRLVCDGLLALLPALSVSYNEINPSAGRAYALIVPDPGPGWFRTFQAPFEAHMHENPLVNHWLRTGDTRVLAWGDPGIGTIEGTHLDEVFYAPNGIRSQLAMLLPAPPGILIGIAINRGPEGFTDREREVVARLRPHLVHAYRAVQLRNDNRLLGAVLGEHGWAVLLVDPDGRVVTSSPGTDVVAARYGLDVAHGARLADGPLAQIQRFIRDYNPANPAVPSPPVRVVGPSGALVAVVVPSWIGPHVVLLRPQPVTVAGLRAAGLTVRQAEVALGLVAGESNAEVARRLGIAPATVKKHLEAIFKRLAVTNRAAAVARIVALG